MFLVPPKIIEETSTINPSPVVEGHLLTLLCFADGIPEPTIDWYFRKRISSHSLTNNHHSRRNPNHNHLDQLLKTSSLDTLNDRIVHNGNKLLIYNVTRNYSGIFECIANNSVPPAASRKIRVTVECNHLLLCFILKINHFLI
jgi:hypothetical protein